MVEIFTVGGGDYLVNVFQAVAAWTGNGGYKSLLQVVMVMGLALSAITLAFNQDWRAWINWFLGATLIYSCLMVPRLDVRVTDRLNPSLAPATVSNVPLGLALMASFTSQVGDYLTGSAEVVFGLPGDLNYSKNGMIYGARLYDATRSLRISDPEFAANLDEHFCTSVFCTAKPSTVLPSFRRMSATGFRTVLLPAPATPWIATMRLFELSSKRPAPS